MKSERRTYHSKAPSLILDGILFTAEEDAKVPLTKEFHFIYINLDMLYRQEKKTTKNTKNTKKEIKKAKIMMERAR